MTRAGATLPCGAKFLVDLDIRSAQFIERARQIGFRVRMYLRCQVARVEQHEFGITGLRGADLNNKVLQVVASAQLQCASRLMGLLLQLLL